MLYNCVKLLFLCTFIVLISCDNKKDNYTAYFGGQIINPELPYLIFSRDNKTLDTLFLDDNSRFMMVFDSLTPGMYSFKHGTDYQYVYFDRNDSLMVAINTADFDQSIVYSGRGNEKNNYMMDFYLMNEKDRAWSYEYYGFELPHFMHTIDSVYNNREAFYNKKKTKIDWSNNFDFYASYRLKLSYFTKKEYYPYLYARRTGNNIQGQLPPEYYNHRENIDFNNPKLTNWSPFARYLMAMLSNMAIARNQKDGTIEENPLQDNIVKLKLADSIFNNAEIKNQILNNIAFSYLLEDQDIDNNRQFLNEYTKLSTDKSSDNEIRKMSEGIKALSEGSTLPTIALVDEHNQNINLTTVIDEQTVIFFWTDCADAQLERVYDKVERLKKQHPDVSFIAINIDEFPEWQKALKKNNFATTEQLRATNFKELKEKWVFTKISRTIILNADGTIKNAFTNLMDTKFDTYLK